MSGEFVDRLNNKQLTNIDQYRRLQRSLSGVKVDDKPVNTNNDNEAWKQWQLVPIAADHCDNEDPSMVDPCSEGAQGIYRAMRQFSRNVETHVLRTWSED